jgi:hypothetical protein
VIYVLQCHFFQRFPCQDGRPPHVSPWETAGASDMETSRRVEVSVPLAGLLFSYEDKLRRERV